MLNVRGGGREANWPELCLGWRLWKCALYRIENSLEASLCAKYSCKTAK